MNDFEKQLDDGTFLRCHQSFIVNMERVTGAENDSFHIGEHVIPISRSYN
ncbi:MAG: LytTR family DNA-binding domain-containing protein, partial [Blautia sp.]